MKNSKKAWIIFRRILLFLFIIYLINYFQVEKGSNPFLEEKTILTEEGIKKFEEDIKNGEYIDIKNYSETTTKDTSNYISNFGYESGEKISKIIGHYLVDFFNFIKEYIS